jgi:hypothetical protein
MRALNVLQFRCAKSWPEELPNNTKRLALYCTASKRPNHVWKDFSEREAHWMMATIHVAQSPGAIHLAIHNTLWHQKTC